METFDLSVALAAYRKEKDYTIRAMADILGMSKSAYGRLERGITKPTYDQVPRILHLLKLEIDAVHIITMDAEPVPLKWNRPRTAHWFIPVVLAIGFQSLMLELPSFRQNMGEDAIAAGKHLRGMIIFSVVFSAFYWFFLPPKWPKRKPNLLEIKRGVAGVVVFLLLCFFEEMVMPVLRWISRFLDSRPAGPWIVIALITALLVLCIWGYRKPIMIRIKTLLQMKNLSNLKKYL